MLALAAPSASSHNRSGCQEDGGEIQDALSDMVGRRTVPQVFIRGKHLGGSHDTVDAYESGELAKLLNISVKDDL
ncbi:hypothetical protein ZWY2020_054305 [Hordeum vulgare]|nr:hypothetical protein ZWY2020_054305 [Hordeum vulgare]